MAAGQKRPVANPDPFCGLVNDPVRPLVFCSGSGRLLRLACLFLGFKSPRLVSALAIKLNETRPFEALNATGYRRCGFIVHREPLDSHGQVSGRL